MTPHHVKTLRQSLFAGPYLANPISHSHKSGTLRKKASQAFQGHQDRRKPTPRATSTMRGKINERKETMLKISQFSPGEVAFAHRFFPTRYNLIHMSGNLRNRTCLDTTCNSQIAKIFPSLAGISIGKQPSGVEKTLRRPLFTWPHLSSPSSTSCKFGTLRKKVSQAFQGHQDCQKPTSRATSTVCAKTNENKINVLKI